MFKVYINAWKKGEDGTNHVNIHKDTYVAEKISCFLNHLINEKNEKGFSIETSPEYWYKGKPIKDDAALIKALVKDGLLKVEKNITVYKLCDEVAEDNDCGFTLSEDDVICMVDASVSELDPGEDLHGIRTFKQINDDGSVAEINGRKYKYQGAMKKLAALGVIEVLTHQSIYTAIDCGYCYLDSEEPLNFLKEAHIFEDYESHLEEEELV